MKSTSSRTRSTPAAGAFLCALPCLALLSSCGDRPAGYYQGYLEAEFVQVAAPLGGTLAELSVARGDEVSAGQALFRLEAESEAAAVRETHDRQAQAEARLANLRKGRRPAEIASLEAQRARARATLQLSESELKRFAELRQGQVISAAEFDVARARQQADQAQVDTLEAELVTARLGARDDEIKAAEAEVEALKASQVRADWALAQKTQAAPVAARVHDTLYRAGEFVGAGMPVVSLFPPGNLKARFFVPEPELASVHPGLPVTVRLDGNPTGVTAKIDYVAPQPEYTPPVIYSRENRAKLVFLVEARLRAADGARLRPGQPVEVTIDR